MAIYCPLCGRRKWWWQPNGYGTGMPSHPEQPSVLDRINWDGWLMATHGRCIKRYWRGICRAKYDSPNVRPEDKELNS